MLAVEKNSAARLFVRSVFYGEMKIEDNKDLELGSFVGAKASTEDAVEIQEHKE